MAPFQKLASLLAVALPGAATAAYYIDDSRGVGRRFDGIGGLSGGGATSRLLPTYPQEQRDQILDYLFTPNFGAALQILKVEIGSDAQSTDGSESSHMHNPWEESYDVGYEFWLMTEAKKRNPDIKLYGLAWGYPQWVSCSPGTLTNCSDSPYTYPQQTATYVSKWVLGALNNYNLTIDYLGIWNERPYDSNYIETLRSVLNSNGLGHIQIVASDSNWNIAADILTDPALASAVSIIGTHYPGTTSTSDAQATQKQLWASEDDSTFNNNVGTGCWARILNQNYVNGEMTATICWNLVASYAKGFNWYRASIMTALQPYSGAYTVSPQVWATAHTTQFTAPGWNYLLNGTGPNTGSGRLLAGGSYVTIQSPDQSAFAIIVEKMSRDHSTCVRPSLADYTTTAEAAVFQLAGSMAGVKQLYLWTSHFAFTTGDEQVEFAGPTLIPVTNGFFSLNVSVDSMYTVTNQATGSKGSYSPPPTPTLFPGAYTDNYNACPISSEASYWTDMNGAFECQLSDDPRHGVIMQQMTPLRPITWGSDTIPHSLWAGGRDFVNVSYVHEVFLPNADSSAWIGVRMQGEDSPSGIIWAVADTGDWNITYSVTQLTGTGMPVLSGTFAGFGPGQWHTFRLDVNGTLATGWLDGAAIFSNLNISNAPTSGHVAIGSVRYGQYPSFDNLQLYTAQTQCGGTTPAAGATISLVQCSTEVGPRPGSSFDFTPVSGDGRTGIFSLRANPNLCISTIPSGNDSDKDVTLPWPVQLAACDTTNVSQQWSQNYTTPYTTFISNTASGRCLDIYGQNAEIGAAVDAWPCNGQAFYYDYLPGEIINIGATVCLGVC